MLRGYVGRATPPSYETHRMEQTGYASDGKLPLPTPEPGGVAVGDPRAQVEQHDIVFVPIPLDRYGGGGRQHCQHWPGGPAAVADTMLV